MNESTLRSEILSELRQMNATLQVIVDYVKPYRTESEQHWPDSTSYRSITDPSTLTPEQIERISRITKEWDKEVLIPSRDLQAGKIYEDKGIHYKEVIGTHGVERVEPVMCVGKTI